MNFSALRARSWGTALAFFVVGVFFASAMDWTPFSHAQTADGEQAERCGGQVAQRTRRMRSCRLPST